MKNGIRYGVIVAFSALLLVLLAARMWRQGSVELSSGYRVIMGTFSRTVVIAGSQKIARECIEAAFEEQRQVDALMSDYAEGSEISRVNRLAYKEPVPVSRPTFDVLRKAAQFSELSGGAFDVTVGPLVDLWRAAGQTNTPVNEEAIAQARAKVGYEKLVLNEAEMTVRFAVEGMRLDLGGIGKGYAVDRSVEAMQNRGALGGMVDLGGNIRCFGRPPRGQRYWRIALQDPNVAPDDMDGSKILLVVALTDESVATSGDYRRFTKIQGEKQSHIMDARSGRGASALTSVTIIAPDATTADALSTAVSVLGPDRGLALIERLPQIEAILIPSGGVSRPVFSSGAQAYVK